MIHIVHKKDAIEYKLKTRDDVKFDSLPVNVVIRHHDRQLVPGWSHNLIM